MFSQTEEVLQDQSYYPYGMSMGEELTYNMPDNLPDNKYLYNGKELQDDFGLDLYDYHARFYDPVIGRFTSVDPLAEYSYKNNPYRFGYNSPINYFDPSGMLEVSQTPTDPYLRHIAEFADGLRKNHQAVDTVITLDEYEVVAKGPDGSGPVYDSPPSQPGGFYLVSQNALDPTNILSRNEPMIINWDDIPGFGPGKKPNRNPRNIAEALKRILEMVGLLENDEIVPAEPQSKSDEEIKDKTTGSGKTSDETNKGSERKEYHDVVKRGPYIIYYEHLDSSTMTGKAHELRRKTLDTVRVYSWGPDPLKK